jgi:hypothetical protein
MTMARIGSIWGELKKILLLQLTLQPSFFNRSILFNMILRLIFSILVGWTIFFIMRSLRICLWMRRILQHLNLIWLDRIRTITWGRISIAFRWG